MRDASGNVMGVYEQRSDLNSGHLTQSEVHLYGSSRLCIFNINRDMITPPTGEITIFERGRKFFEGVNHLGNVLVTISDRKIGVQDPNNTTQILYYIADVVTATDYYPFGMDMPGRKFSFVDGYQYGFGGKRKNNEIYGEGAAYDFGARIYDTRIGRWFSVDPLSQKYPFLSPFIYTNDNPILFKDFDGKDWIITTTTDKKGNQTVTLKLTAAVINNSSDKSLDIHKFSQAAADQIKNIYSVEYEKTVTEGLKTFSSGLDGYPRTTVEIQKDITVTFKIEVDIRVINKETELKDNEHLISVEDQKNMGGEETAGRVNKIGGKRIKIAAAAASDVAAGINKNTVAHEAGHTLGLKHSDVKYELNGDRIFRNVSKHYIKDPKERFRNLMKSKEFFENEGMDLTISQMERIRRNVKEGKVNKR